MNITTTTGYQEMIIYNDYERILYIIFIFIGNAMLALGFGLFRSNSRLVAERYDVVFERIRKLESVLDNPDIRLPTRKKVQNFFAFSVNMEFQNENAIEALAGRMPTTTLQQMEFEQLKSITNYQLLQDFSLTRTFSNMLVGILEKRLYMPSDFIVAKVLMLKKN